MAGPVDSKDSLAELERKKLQEEIDKLPSVEELNAEIEALEKKKQTLAKAVDVKYNFGLYTDPKTGVQKDKGGKRPFNLPKMPISLGRITISGINFEGQM